MSGSTLFASILNSSVILGNYLQQTISADDIFRCIFFLGALRVNYIVAQPLGQSTNLVFLTGISKSEYFLFLIQGVVT